MRNKFPNLGRTKEIKYRGYIIHLYEDDMVGVVLGNVSVYNSLGREMLHATLDKGVAFSPEGEASAKWIVDAIIEDRLVRAAEKSV